MIRPSEQPDRTLPMAIAILVAVLAAAPSPSEASAWRADPIWDDGNAEFCAYTVNWSRYGTLYDGSAVLILVKEPWAPDLEVKADSPRPDGFDVLKLNHIRDVATGIYTYHQMASAFVRRGDGGLQKLATTSSEGCGISTAHMVDGVLETRSYFDGQGESRRPWPEGAIADDALPARLRDFLEGEPPATVAVVPSLLTGRFPSLEPVEHELTRAPAGTFDGPDGPVEAVAISLERGGQVDRYLFAAASPHPLLELERADGTVYRLAKCERIPYWRMNRPGGENWLPEAVR